MGVCQIQNIKNELYKRGYSKFEMKDNKREIADFDKAIELDPKNAAAYFSRGTTKPEMHDYKEAIADFDKAIELDPENIDHYRELIEGAIDSLNRL